MSGFVDFDDMEFRFLPLLKNCSPIKHFQIVPGGNLLLVQIEQRVNTELRQSERTLLLPPTGYTGELHLF